MKRPLLLALLAAAPAAHADLYRWVDPQTGSVKYSSYPPPWYGNPAREISAPATEVLVYRPPAPRPGVPANASANPSSSASSSLVAAFEARLAEIVQALQSLPSDTDFSRAGAGIQQQLEAYRAVLAELDRLDPAGTARRREQEAGILETLRRGVQAQLGREAR